MGKKKVTKNVIYFLWIFVTSSKWIIWIFIIYSDAFTRLDSENAAIAMTRSRTATSTWFQPASKDNAIMVSQAATTRPPVFGLINTIIPAIISITPTIIMKSDPEKGSISSKPGLMYAVQSVSMFRNLSVPAAIGRMVKVYFNKWVVFFKMVSLYVAILLLLI